MFTLVRIILDHHVLPAGTLFPSPPSPLPPPPPPPTHNQPLCPSNTTNRRADSLLPAHPEVITVNALPPPPSLHRSSIGECLLSMRCVLSLVCASLFCVLDVTEALKFIEVFLRGAESHPFATKKKRLRHECRQRHKDTIKSTTSQGIAGLSPTDMHVR